jgi:threonine/homoserine/homoserine lactone efflux protein
MGEIVWHVLSVLPAFVLGCLAVAALPGPSTALFPHRTVRDGRGAGLAAVAGNDSRRSMRAPTRSSAW